MSQKRVAVCLTVSEIQRQKWTGESFYPPLAGIRVKCFQLPVKGIKMLDISLINAKAF